MNERTSRAERAVTGGVEDEPPVIAVDRVSKHFGKVRAVRDVSLSIRRGEVVAFLGPNGAGKTTTLDMVLGLSTPTSGTVDVCGGSPRQAIDGGSLAAVLQTGSLLVEYTVSEIVSMLSGFLTKSRPVAEVLDRAGLTDIKDRRISKCSGGEQQRLRFAIALLSDPAVLVLDEPTAGMDVTARRRFWDAMKAEAERGKTIVFATHYLGEAEEFAERTVIMDRGRVVADGTTGEIRRYFGVQEIKAGFDAPRHLEEAAARISRLATVDHSGGVLSVTGTDTVALAREVLACPGIVSISITDQSLDDAFERLTHETPEDPAETDAKDA